MNQTAQFYDTHTLFTPLDFELKDFRCTKDIQTKIYNIIYDSWMYYSSTTTDILSLHEKNCNIYVSVEEKRSKAFIFISNTVFYYFLLGKDREGFNREKNWDTLRDGKAKYHIPLKLCRASVGVIHDKYMHNILKCKSIPECITRKDLYDIFSPFASSECKQIKYMKNKRIEEPYPFISIDKEGIVFIVFDPNSQDAQFALLLNKNLTINIDGDEYLLIFNHSYSKRC